MKQCERMPHAISWNLQTNSIPRVVIIGGGFAGMNAAKLLGGLPVQVTLVDRRNFHLFQPLLYQVASGGLSPGDIAAPLRDVLSRFPNVRTLMAEVTGFDPANGRILLHDQSDLPYDTLILAAGAENFYFGNPQWQQFAPGLKTIEDATKIRSRILSAFEKAELETDPEVRRSWLRFVVVGAGPTGVELAGAIGEIARDTLRHDFRAIRPAEAQILLLEGAKHTLPQFKEDLSDKAERALIKLGVRVRTGVRVTNIDAAGVSLITDAGSAERIEARTVIWAAGVRASGLGKKLADAVGAETDRGGRIKVSGDLSIPGHPQIFVLGDLAWFEQDGTALPGLCPVAMQQGWYAARVIKLRLQGKVAPPFHYMNKGIMATIGRASAVADLGFIRFGGVFAWLAWLFIHLMYLVGFRSRFVVAIQWGFQYLTFNRGARLITGKDEPS